MSLTHFALQGEKRGVIMIMNDLANDFWIYLCMAQRKNGDPSCPAGDQNSVMMIMNDPSSRWHLGPQVRKEEGAELLRSLGAEYVVVTSKWTFDHYYDGQNDANDDHFHGDDDRDKGRDWLPNRMNFWKN